MRRAGLGLMLGLGLAAGGIGAGWLAATLEGGDVEILDVSDTGQAAAPDMSFTPSVPEPVADTALLYAAASRMQSLEAEVARLRWRVSDLRRQCMQELPARPPALAAPSPSEVGGPALAGPVDRPAVDIAAVDTSVPPGALIVNPPREAVAPTPRAPQQAVASQDPGVPPPPFPPERERAPARVAAVEPTPVAVPQRPPRSAADVLAPVQRDAPPAPEPLYSPGQALSVPEEAVRTRDLSFLDGCWLSEGFANPVNGSASTKIYCFDAAGNGQMSFRGVDGITCRADVRARWEPGRRLVLDEPQDGTCGSIGVWHREVTNCVIGGDGRARCDSYEFYRQFNYATRMTRI